MVHARFVSALCGVLALCSFAVPRASATTYSGNFTADNSSFELTFTEGATTNFTAATTSFATGGFLPILTLYNDSTGMFVASDGSGPEAGLGDVSLAQSLDAGTYDLFLTEFPNAPINNLADGFLLQGDPTATGDTCNTPGGMFLNTTVAPCTQRSSAYSLTTNAPVSVAATPEPPSALLLVLPLAGVVVLNRKRLASAATL
jgi:hypothetical protein